MIHTPAVDYKWKAAGVAAVGLALSLLDNTIVSVALPAMQKTFGTDFSTITWVGAGFFLASAAMIGVTGYLGDWAGTRRIYLASMLLLTVASALCMIAPTAGVLVAMRVVQGIGGGALWPISFAIAYRAFPANERGQATAVVGVPVLLVPAFGPVVGGFLTTAFSWRAIFAINIPIGIAALLLGARILRGRGEDTTEEDEAARQRGRFDVAGFALSMIAFTVLIAGLTEAGARGWADPLVDALLVAGAVTLLVFVIVERRVAHPVLDLRLFLNATFARANVLLWLLVALYYAGVYLIPYFFETVRGYSAVAAGAIVIPQGLATAVAIAASGALYNRLGPRTLALAGTLLLTASTVGFLHLDVGTSGASLQLWLILRGLGLGLATPALQNLTVALVERHAVSRASSLVNVTQQVAGAAGLGGLAAFMAARTAVHRGTMVAGGSQSTRECGGQAETVFQCLHRHAAAQGLDDTFWFVFAGYAVCILLAFFVGSDPSLSRSPGGIESQPPEGASELSAAGMSGGD